MAIFVIHVRNRGRVPLGAHYEYCGRPSVLGNPYFLHHEDDRDMVCDHFELYWSKALIEDRRIKEAFDRLKGISLSKDVYLGCYCEPKRCHCRTIKHSLENS